MWFFIKRGAKLMPLGAAADRMRGPGADAVATEDRWGFARINRTIFVACKLTIYEENGQKRYAVLYADSKWTGYYLLREITGLPELADEEYLALLKELEGIIGLTIPALEQLAE